MAATTTTLEAQVRTDLGSPNARRERNVGRVPAVVYGHGGDSVAVSVDALEFNRILHSETGANTLIELDIAGKKETALARQIHRHPTKPQIVHVDFIRVNMNEEVVAEVSLHLEGEPEGVKDGGRLEQIHFTITVKAKPADIPVSLTHDVSAVTLGGNVQMSEIELPAGVTSEIEPDVVLAVVSVPRGQTEEEEAAEAAALAEAEAAAGEGGEGAAAPAAEASAEGEKKE
jgi:large subunit ribosomal protein L25